MSATMDYIRAGERERERERERESFSGRSCYAFIGGRIWFRHTQTMKFSPQHKTGEMARHAISKE